MKRILKIRVGPDKDSDGLELVVPNTEADGDDTDAEIHTFKHRDVLASDNVLKAAVAKAVDQYLAKLREDSQAAIDNSPIAKAAR